MSQICTQTDLEVIYEQRTSCTASLGSKSISETEVLECLTQCSRHATISPFNAILIHPVSITFSKHRHSCSFSRNIWQGKTLPISWLNLTKITIRRVQHPTRHHRLLPRASLQLNALINFSLQIAIDGLRPCFPRCATQWEQFMNRRSFFVISAWRVSGSRTNGSNVRMDDASTRPW